MAQKKDVKYVGASIEEFIAISSQQLKAGKYFDGVTIPDEVRKGLDGFVKALQSPSINARHYVFVYSTHVFVNVEHDVLNK